MQGCSGVHGDRSSRRVWAGARRWACLLGLLATTSTSWAQPARIDEYQLKLAFLYNFAQYVEWPANAFAAPESPFALCVLGRDPFGGQLQQLESRKLRGRAVTVSSLASVQRARGCHLLYVDDAHDAAAAAQSLAGAPVLVVTHLRYDAELGAAIGFVQQGERLRWSVNLEVARRSGLRLSAKLLELAVRVSEPTG